MPRQSTSFGLRKAIEAFSQPAVNDIGLTGTRARGRTWGFPVYTLWSLEGVLSPLSRQARQATARILLALTLTLAVPFYP